MSATPPNAIFICYRREDSNTAAFSIYRRLQEAFGEEAIFYDDSGFAAGDEWRKKTPPILKRAKAVLVLIHKDWLAIGKKRFSKLDDPVRNEIELALANQLEIIPVLIDGTKIPDEKDQEAFRKAGHEDIANLLKSLTERIHAPIRFGRDFEPDIELLLKTLGEIQGIESVGRKTSFDMCGLEVLLPWGIIAQPPTEREPHCSDLWILQAKYQSIPLVNRDEDMTSLDNWLEAEQRIAARLLVGRAGTGKTRLGYEFILRVSREKGDRWDTGVISGDSFRNVCDWNSWEWDRPTLLVFDYAQSVEQNLRKLLVALTQKATNSKGPSLRLLLLERVADSKDGWFKRLLESENSVGGGPVARLFIPPEPVQLKKLDTEALRHHVLSETFRIASGNRKKVSNIPALGTDRKFDDLLRTSKWNEPLYLMMAGLIANDLFQGEQSQLSPVSALRTALELGRTDLAVHVAKHESRRLGFLMPNDDNAQDLLRHMAAVATLQGGLSATEAISVARSEADSLGLIWPAGPGNLASRLHDAFPADDRGIEAIQPDIIAEAYIVATFCDRLSEQQQSEAILRNAKQKTAQVASTLFHAFQNFCDDDIGESYLSWIGSLIETGISSSTDWLLALEESLPDRSAGLRTMAADVTRALVDKLKEENNSSPDDSQLALIATKLIALSSRTELSKESIDASVKAVEICRLLPLEKPTFRMNLATALTNLAVGLASPRPTNVNQNNNALVALDEAIDIFENLVERDPKTCRPRLANSFIAYGIVLGWLGRSDEAMESAKEAVLLMREQIEQFGDEDLPGLAHSLDNLAGDLAISGRYSDAISLKEESISLYRELTLRDPDAYRTTLASSLEELAEILSHSRQPIRALELAKEAAELYRILYDASPRFRSSLADGLHILAGCYKNSTMPEEALLAYEEAIKLARIETEVDVLFGDRLAKFLNDRSILLASVERRGESAIARREAVASCRLAVKEDPSYWPHLAESLVLYSMELKEDEKKVLLIEAIELYRQSTTSRHFDCLGLVLTQIENKSLCSLESNAYNSTFQVFASGIATICNNLDQVSSKVRNSLTRSAERYTRACVADDESQAELSITFVKNVCKLVEYNAAN